MWTKLLELHIIWHYILYKKQHLEWFLLSIFKVTIISKLVSVTIIAPYPGYFFLVILHPLTPTLILDYKSPVVHPVGGVESSLPPLLQDPIAVTPAPWISSTSHLQQRSWIISSLTTTLFFFTILVCCFYVV